MKKRFILSLTLILLFVSSVLLLTSCSGNTYTVTFNTDGGSAVEPQKIAAGGFVQEPPAPTKEGYTFGGWYRYSDPWNFDYYAIGMDITLVAKWIPNYTVNFIFGNGDESLSLTVPEGSKLISPQEPKRENFEFIGWYAGDKEWDFEKDTVSSNVDITAKWREIFNIKYDAAGGTYTAPQKVKEGEKLTEPATPIKTGYLFLGWYAGDEKWDFSSAVTSAITLTARWEKQYAVHFNTDGGKELDFIYVSEGAPIPVPEELTKAGYIFDHWYNGADPEKKPWSFETDTVTSNMTLCAKWKKIHTVRFDSAGGSPISELKVTDGDKITAPQVPTREFYLFDAWIYGENGAWDFENSTVTRDMTLTAKWRANYYLVVFDVAGGSGDFPSQMVTLGEKVKEPYNTPSKDEFAFSAWKYNGQKWNFALDTINTHSTITLVADWISIFYNITFNIDGNTNFIPAQRVSIYNGLIQKPEDPVKPGYSFRGWSFNGELWHFSTAPIGDMELIALFEKEFTVSFDTVGGSPLDALKVIDGQLVTKPDAPIKSGYRFAEWLKPNGEVWDFSTDKVTEDITLTARWVELAEISFDTAGGSVGDSASIPSVEIDINSYIEEPPTPFKEGYTFKGWQTSDGTLWDFSNDIATKSMTLTAKWNKLHTVTYDLSGGYGNFPPEKLEEGTKGTPPKVLPSKEHYIFAGWAKLGEDTVWDWAEPITEDIVVVALWKPKEYTIIFDSNGGTTTPPMQSVAYGSTIEEPEGVVRNEFYVLLGWYVGDTAERWDFTKTPESDMVLKAWWFQIRDEDGGGGYVAPEVGTLGPPDVFG